MKIRLYNHDKEKMVKVEKIIVTTKDDVLLIPEVSDRYTHMLSTGRKDKNGKEIWGADLVQTPYGKAMVKFIQGESAYCLIFENGTQKYLHNFIAKELKVIGNVFDNPLREE